MFKFKNRKKKAICPNRLPLKALSLLRTSRSFWNVQSASGSQGKPYFAKLALIMNVFACFFSYKNII